MDVRALLINPAHWSDDLTPIETVVHKAANSTLLPHFHMHMVFNENYRAFAFLASKVSQAQRARARASTPLRIRHAQCGHRCREVLTCVRACVRVRVRARACACVRVRA
eukprot:5585414-Pleurochrysis_carterae.AAC.1